MLLRMCCSIFFQIIRDIINDIKSCFLKLHKNDLNTLSVASHKAKKRICDRYTYDKNLECIMFHRGIKFKSLHFVVFYRYAELEFLDFSVPKKSCNVLNLL